jgi:hypothetical protein
VGPQSPCRRPSSTSAGAPTASPCQSPKKPQHWATATRPADNMPTAASNFPVSALAMPSPGKGAMPAIAAGVVRSEFHKLCKARFNDFCPSRAVRGRARDAPGGEKIITSSPIKSVEFAPAQASETYEMTPLQNDPQQRRREAKHRTHRVSRGPDLSPDLDSARTMLQKSSLGSEFGPRSKKKQATSGSGEGEKGAPKWTRAGPSRIQCKTEELPTTPDR